jgi:hypothetical protein
MPCPREMCTQNRTNCAGAEYGEIKISAVGTCRDGSVRSSTHLIWSLPERPASYNRTTALERIAGLSHCWTDGRPKVVSLSRAYYLSLETGKLFVDVLPALKVGDSLSRRSTSRTEEDNE